LRQSIRIKNERQRLLRDVRVNRSYRNHGIHYLGHSHKCCLLKQEIKLCKIAKGLLGISLNNSTSVNLAVHQDIKNILADYLRFSCY